MASVINAANLYRFHANVARTKTLRIKRESGSGSASAARLADIDAVLRKQRADLEGVIQLLRMELGAGAGDKFRDYVQTQFKPKMEYYPATQN